MYGLLVVKNVCFMNKLAVIIPYFKRPELTRICFENIKEQSERLVFDVFVCGDDKELSDEFGFTFVDFPNDPLSKKNNALIGACKDYDGVVLVGSDNFLSDEIFEIYQNMDLNSPTLYGFDNLHFYSTDTKELVTDGVYGENQSIGVGRLFTKQLLEGLKYKPWTGSVNKGLDSNCSKNVKNKGFEEVILPYSALILDVKHESNITSHSIMKSCKTVCDLSLIEKYEAVLALDKSEKPKQLKHKKTKSFKMESKVVVLVLKEIHGMNIGDRITLKSSLAKILIDKGIVKNA